MQYDGLKIKQLCKTGTETDAAKLKNDMTLLESLKKEIRQVTVRINCLCRKKENQILEIKLDLK